MSPQLALFILYVRDQAHATDFYRAVLEQEPSLDVPGMTEFHLLDNALLGLMPCSGIQHLIGDTLPDPMAADGIPRAEVYLVVPSPGEYHARALAHGGRELSPLQPRAWGHRVAYSLDPDGHVLAFAEIIW